MRQPANCMTAYLFLGAEVLGRHLPLLENGAPGARNRKKLKSAMQPQLTKEMSPIDFSKTAQQIHNQIRGLPPWPAAFVMIQGKRLKIYHSRLVPEIKGKAGQLLHEQRFIVGCGDGRGN